VGYSGLYIENYLVGFSGVLVLRNNLRSLSSKSLFQHSSLSKYLAKLVLQ
jgi:hypothetical protein